MRKYQHAKEKKMSERVGFYIALSICMMAVGLAVWSAYATFTDPTDNSDNMYFSSLSTENAAVGQEMTGVTEEETQEPTQEPTEVQEETVAATEKKGFTISETLPSESGEGSGEKLSAMQAVLKVKEDLIYPVKSHTVIKEYSEDSVYNKTMRDYRAHTGCDFAADGGENVYAMCKGVVKEISVSELYGMIIEVDCGDFFVYYCGLSSDLVVDKGDEVSAGDTIGTVGRIPSESSDDSHIHIEIRVGDKIIDPLSVIDRES